MTYFYWNNNNYKYNFNGDHELKQSDLNPLINTNDCISWTASIDYLLVRALEHILTAFSFISFSFLSYSIVFFFTLPFVHSFISCVFLYFFSYENISTSQKEVPCIMSYVTSKY